jgi:hypothetical protein
MLGFIGLIFSGKFLIGLGIGSILVYFFKPIIDSGIKKIIKKNI